MTKKPKRPKDSNQRAKLIVELATSNRDSNESFHNTIDPKKNPAAVELGRLGGLKGGKARAAKLSKKKRSEIAKKAAKRRWAKE